MAARHDEPELSVARILTELKDQIEHHRRQEVFHAEQEVFHREERARHAVDLQVAVERLATFEAAADAAGELVTRALEKKQKEEEKERIVEDSIPPGKQVLSKRVDRIVFAKDMEESFGVTGITREIQERYGARLKRKIDVRTVGAKLRRMVPPRTALTRHGERTSLITSLQELPGGVYGCRTIRKAMAGAGRESTLQRVSRSEPSGRSADRHPAGCRDRSSGPL